MSKVRLYGSTSGYTEIIAPAVSSDTTVTLPTSGTIAKTTDMGLRQVVPTSVSVASGSGSADANGTITFTSASTINLDGIFSTTYDYYRIILNTTTGGSYFALRGRTAGSTDSSAYHSNATYSFRSGNAAAVDTANEGATSMAILAGTGNAIFFTGEINNPFSSSKETHVVHKSLYVSNSTGYNTIACWGGARVAANVSYDGMAFLFGTAATGNIRVYGYRNQVS